MNNVEFLSYTPTPNEKHEGVATIRVDRRFIFRFKITANPKGEGYFSNAPSLKIDENYYPAFTFDSSYESDEVRKFVLNHAKNAMQERYSPPAFTPQISMPPMQYQEAPQQQQEFSFNPQPTPF